MNGSDKDLKLLRPYLHELQVNGKPCRVLRDSAATMDVVHPSYVTPSDFTGKVVWIKQLLEKHGSDRDLKLLRPYLHELQVNGKPCRVLRDSAATMDVVHPSYVTPSDFTGK
ncbi:MAG: hypothetical protein O7C62_04400, partial [Rickettsia endosymbiont of Ixodes persulcatus]|nr:hypothetical protein [Rickettsia endosymbiont of Ixodes persulcatus]